MATKAAVRDEQWYLASALFDQAEARHTSGSAYCRREVSGLDDRDDRGDDGRHRSIDNANFGEEDGRGSAAASGRVAAGGAERLPVRPEGGGRGDSSRVPRELMKGAIDATAPTARTYSLALQVNVLKEIEGFVFFFSFRCWFDFAVRQRDCAAFLCYFVHGCMSSEDC